MEEFRLIILNHGEDILTAYMRFFEKYLDNEISKLKENIKKSHAVAIKSLSGKENDPLSPNYYSEKKKYILKQLKTILIPDDEKDEMYAMVNPYLSDKGLIQANYSGEMLKLYLKKKNLTAAKIAFSSPSMSTLHGSTKVLSNYKENDRPEIVIVPDFIETKKQYKKEKFGSYEVLDDNFDPKNLMSTNSDEIVVERFTKGLEKVFSRIEEASKEGIPIVMIHGSILDTFFKVHINGEDIKIEDSAAYDITILFNENGKFVSVKLNTEIQMNANLRALCNNELGKLNPLKSYNEYDEALAYINGELQKFLSEILKILPKNKTNESESTNKKRLVKKVSFKEDIERDIERDTKNIFEEAKKDIKRKKEEAKENLKIGVEDFFKKTTENIKKSIEEGIEKGIEYFLKKTKEHIEKGIEDFFKKTKEHIEEWIQYCLDETKEDIEKAIQKDIEKAIQEVAQYFLKKITQDFLKEAKKDIEKAIQEGIQEVTQDLLKEITQDLLTSAKKVDILGVFDGFLPQKNLEEELAKPVGNLAKPPTPPIPKTTTESTTGSISTESTTPSLPPPPPRKVKKKKSIGM